MSTHVTQRAAVEPILAFDTANQLGSVAVGTPGHVRVELTIGASARHAESLLPAIDLALRMANVQRCALGAVIVGAGPGSFTGVRIAASTAKAIARALDLPLYAHSSLALLAAGAAAPGRAVCALFDARRAEVYAACYRFGSAGDTALRPCADVILAPCVARVEDVAGQLAPYDPVWVGEGALRYADRIGRAGSFAPAALSVPRASSLLWLHAIDTQSSRVSDLAHWTPDYIRSPGAVRAS